MQVRDSREKERMSTATGSWGDGADVDWIPTQGEAAGGGRGGGARLPDVGANGVDWILR
jgi:hypothetical protein